MSNYTEQIADILEDLMQGHNWDYADKEFRKLTKKAFEDGYMQGKIDEAMACSLADRHSKAKPPAPQPLQVNPKSHNHD